jgi:thiamine biosynthesis protein ThiC
VDNGERRSGMNTYVILRRGAWSSATELGQAAERSKAVGDEQMSDDIRWIRSYVLEEPDGTVGTVCIYQASSPEAIREHASRADLAADEIIPVADTVVVRDDPAPAATG